ncbi:MAG: hypothetical protein Q7O12_02715 [Deltaproteobacteria bacterium]|nr:hypothetical protein [Deltaproteobacteria bacterium]
MKTGRFLVLLALVMGLLAGPWQAPAEAIMLGRVGQIINLSYDAPNWKQTKPDGTTSIFTLAPGQSFIMTEIRVRFYATIINSGPYRFYLLGPQSSRLYITNLNDVMYPGTQTVWGGASTDTNLVPGVVFTSPPTPEVRQMPSPPANPNSGDVRPGTFYLTVRGYVLP